MSACCYIRSELMSYAFLFTQKAASKDTCRDLSWLQPELGQFEIMATYYSSNQGFKKCAAYLLGA